MDANSKVTFGGLLQTLEAGLHTAAESTISAISTFTTTTTTTTTLEEEEFEEGEIVRIR